MLNFYDIIKAIATIALIVALILSWFLYDIGLPDTKFHMVIYHKMLNKNKNKSQG